MNVPIIKASIAAITSGAIGKFYSRMPNSEAIKSGLLTGGAVIVTDTLFSLSTMLPSWFAPLGYYAQDIASSLLDAGVRWLVRTKTSMMWTTTNGGFLTDFLISLGSSVIASYANVPVRSMLPSTLANLK